MRIAITGSRDFHDYSLLKKTMDHLTKRIKHPIMVISGGARGADRLAEKWAFERRHSRTIYHADWKEYRKQAGIIRNIQMANNADALVAFWDGESPGTRHMIDAAIKKGLLIRVILYEEGKVSYQKKRGGKWFSRRL